VSGLEKRYDYITPKDYITAEMNGITERALNQRVRDYGWDVDRAITQPMRKSTSFKKVWDKWEDTATKNGVSHTRFYHRIKNDGWSEEKAATQKVSNGRWTEKQLEVMKMNNLTPNTVNMRITKMGWSEEKALHTPKMTEAERVKRVGEGTRKYHRERGVNSEFNKTR